MRIGFDVSPITRTRTGVGNYCHYLLKHLLELEEDCVFRAFSSGMAEIDLGDLAASLGHRHIPVPTRFLYLLWNTVGLPRVDKLLGNVDVYHATNYFLPPTRSARRVVTVHDLAFLAVPEFCSAKIVQPFSGGIGRFCRDADAILAYSESTKGDIVQYLDVDPDRITVAPMAVDEGFLPLAREEAAGLVAERYGISEPFLLFVSTLDPRKNVIGLLRAFALLAKEIPHRLVLIGSPGWNADAIFETIENLGIGDRIVRPGFVPHLELPAFYCAADAFVFPTHYEGFGLPLLEALVCGCPVVTADNSSVPEVTGDGALRVDSKDVEGFANAVRLILSDSELREKLVAKGKAHAEKFSWHTCARTTMDLYRKLATC